ANFMKDLPHPEERPKGASRRTHEDATTLSSRGGAADGQPVHAQGRLADPDRHALAILAAGADPVIELEVVADHRDLVHRVGAVADQGGALDRRADLAVLDQICFGSGKDELARSDIDAAAAEIDRVEAALDRAHDLLRV